MTDPSPQNQRASPVSEPVHAPPAATEPVPETPPEALETPPEPFRGPRLWPRIVGALVLFLGAGGAWVWQNPGTLTALWPMRSGDEGAALAMKALETRLARLEQRPMPTDPALLAARLDALEKRPAAQELRPLIARLDALETRIARGTSPVPSAAAGEDLRPLLNRLDALERGLAEGGAEPGRVDAIASRVDALAGRDPAAEMRARLEELERQIGGLSAKGAGVAEAADRTARQARLHAAVVALSAGRPLGAIAGAPPALTRFATTAPPTEAALRLAFPAASRAALKASLPDTEGKPFLDRVLARLQDFRLVTVREGDRVLVGHAAVAVLASAQARLDAGDLAGAVHAVATLSGPPAEKMAAWLADAKALAAAREALASLSGDG